jgi:heme exporter protein A
VLSVSGLACVRGERELFSELNFSVPPYTLLIVRGPNGSGKTSLLRILCGLLSAAGGRIAWNGSDIRRCREEYCAQLVYIGHPNALKDELSGVENLEFAARIAGLAISAGSADSALCRVGLDGFQHLPCKALSQGQRRRAALARLSLSALRPLWLLDEPFAALDSAAAAIIRELLEAHLRAGGMVVMTAHQDLAISAHSVQHIELGS